MRIVKCCCMAVIVLLGALSARPALAWGPDHDPITISKCKIIHHKTTGDVEVTSGHAQANLSVDFVVEWNSDDHAGHGATITWNYGDGTTGSSSSHTYASAPAGTCNVSVEIECFHQGILVNDSAGGLTVHVINGIEVTKVGGQAVGVNNRMSFNDACSAEGRVLPVGTPGSDLIDWFVQVSLKYVVKLNGASPTMTLPDADWPQYNTSWGSGYLFVTIDGEFSNPSFDEDGELLHGATAFLENTQTVKKFYNATGTESPGNDPNWYYYYTDALNNGPHQYDAGVNWGATSLANPPVVSIGSNANGNSPRWPGATGINNFANIVQHEMWHRSNLQYNWNTHGQAVPPNGVNPDGDDLDATWEANIGTDPNKFATFGTLPDHEHGAQTAETNTNHSVEDWAHPGSQW